MREHVINVQLKVEARDWISRADLIADLRKQLEALQEPPPYRHNTGSGWWTNSRRAVAINYENVGEQLEYEIEAGLRTVPTHPYCGSDSGRQSVGGPGHCEDCARYGHVKAHPDLGCGDVGCYVSHTA